VFQAHFDTWKRSHKSGLEIITKLLNKHINEFHEKTDASGNDVTSWRLAQIHTALKELGFTVKDLTTSLNQLHEIEQRFHDTPKISKEIGYVRKSLAAELHNKTLVAQRIFSADAAQFSDTFAFYASVWKHQPDLNITEIELSLHSLKAEIVPV